MAHEGLSIPHKTSSQTPIHFCHDSCGCIVTRFRRVRDGIGKIRVLPFRNPQKQLFSILKLLLAPALERTDEVVSKIEGFIQKMDESTDVEAIVTTIGQYTENHRTQVETSHAEVKIDLLDADDLTYSIEQIKGSIRKYLETVPGASLV